MLTIVLSYQWALYIAHTTCSRSSRSQIVENQRKPSGFLKDELQWALYGAHTTGSGSSRSQIVANNADPLVL